MVRKQERAVDFVRDDRTEQKSTPSLESTVPAFDATITIFFQLYPGSGEMQARCRSRNPGFSGFCPDTGSETRHPARDHPFVGFNAPRHTLLTSGGARLPSRYRGLMADRGTPRGPRDKMGSVRCVKMTIESNLWIKLQWDKRKAGEITVRGKGSTVNVLDASTDETDVFCPIRRGSGTASGRVFALGFKSRVDFDTLLRVITIELQAAASHTAETSAAAVALGHEPNEVKCVNCASNGPQSAFLPLSSYVELMRSADAVTVVGAAEDTRALSLRLLFLRCETEITL
ncbi:hypothetical protein B0H19DRAFT_1086466 [Mycena capillaripes]|nr:hypothetical protein B0H19DRAFT_1086466 [Mycena capillaripes]